MSHRSQVLIVRFVSLALLLPLWFSQPVQSQEPYFGQKFKNLENRATGEWWKKKPNKRQPMDLDVPRNEVVAFALYTHDSGTLKMSAQLFPLKPGEPREVVLEFKSDDGWKEIAREKVIELGWSAHFRFDDWDNTKDVEYRVRHGEEAEFVGLIRKDPIDKDEIVIANLSCNSGRTPGPRPTIVENIKKQNPDMLFFAGDQTYHHTQHTYGWLEWGRQFRDIIGDRPVITIPDDHDVGQGNIWGENGKKASSPAGSDGGYFYPAKFVNMVQRCQTWHLPDPADPKTIEQGITVYFTRLRVGGIDFAILEDRKFKSGPEGKIPKMGPRPDHINDPSYDRSAVDLPELKLLGDRQLQFLHNWSQDYRGAEMKCVLSQTAFCGAVHIHGKPDSRLLADLDSNAWPQKGRNKALVEVRRAWASHLCGDQHLAVAVKHGIENHGDGPYAFTSPALVNTIYGRWWHPEDEKAGKNEVMGSPLPWTGEYLDGLGNKITMLAYANPEDRTDETKRSDGYGLVRFNKKNRTTTFECWPRFADLEDGDKGQFAGWPITFDVRKNDGRKPVGHLPELVFDDGVQPVVQIQNSKSGEILYTIRCDSNRFRPPVYAEGSYTAKIGHGLTDVKTIEDLKIVEDGSDKKVDVKIK